MRARCVCGRSLEVSTGSVNLDQEKIDSFWTRHEKCVDAHNVHLSAYGEQIVEEIRSIGEGLAAIREAIRRQAG